MIIIGEKINGSIPSVAEAIAKRDAEFIKARAIARRYADALFRREGLHPYEDAEGRFLARLADVEPDGRFVLQDEAGRLRRYLFKEVQYIL